VALLDGDIIAYTTAARAANGDCIDHDDLVGWVRGSVQEWAPRSFFNRYVLYMSDSSNFRMDIYPEYKANRKGQPKPKLLQMVKDILHEEYQAIVVANHEADDAIATAMYVKYEDETPVAVTTDKDFAQLEGWHWNPNKDDWPRYIDQNEANYNLAIQALMGDSTDNIKGLPGIGVKKATKMLDAWIGEAQEEDCDEPLIITGPEHATQILYQRFYEEREEDWREQWDLNWAMVCLKTNAP